MSKLSGRPTRTEATGFLPPACHRRADGQGRTYPELAAYTGLSMSGVHGGLRRAEAARLLFFEAKQPRIILPAFEEFLFHGAKYAFPAMRGSMVAGVPTAHAAAPLNTLIAPSAEPPPVWPSIDGTVRGIADSLYPSAPAALLSSPALHERLALFDALRAGNIRERTLAQKLFEERL